MLVIRDEQMAVLNQYADKRFAKKMMNFLNQHFDNARQTPKEELLPMVKEQIGKARSYGLITETQIATYVTSAWLWGMDFDTEIPEAEEILTSSKYPADDKAELLVEWSEIKFKEKLNGMGK